MGGSAFAKEGIETMRMPPEVYISMRDQLIAILQQHFAHAASPIEAPGKKDHGDIDILVCSPLDNNHNIPPTLETLASLVGASHWKQTPNSSTSHFALPWPSTNPTSHIQLDIHLCHTPSEFAWVLFNHAHGDLWNMLGSIIRRYGLVCTTDGLYLRIAELESYSRSLSRVFITSEPTRVLRFLGLDETIYFHQFPTLDSLVAYAASCRFFDPKEELRLKANDRQRVEKRQAFRYWVDVFLPACVAGEKASRGKSASLTREEVVEEVKREFGTEVAERFERQKEMGLKAMGRERMWAEVRREVGLQGERLGTVMKALKIAVEDGVGGEDVDGVDEARKMFEDGRFDEVKIWAVAHWEEVVREEESRG